MIRGGRFFAARAFLEEGLRFVESSRTRRNLFNNLATSTITSTTLRSLRLAVEHDLRNEAFFTAAYYLFKLSSEGGDAEDAARYRETAAQFRSRLQQRSEEAEAFDRIGRAPAKRTAAGRAIGDLSDRS